jgi:hypothetical protein
VGEALDVRAGAAAGEDDGVGVEVVERRAQFAVGDVEGLVDPDDRDAAGDVQ